MTNENIDVINKHISELGYNDLYDFALNQLLKIAEEKVTKSQESITTFEEKYQMDFDSFNNQFHSIEIDLIEKEDDEIDWEVELSFLESHQKTLSELKNIKNESDDKK